MQSKQDEAAVADFSKVIQLDPQKYPDVYVARGLAFRRQKAYSQAADDLDIAVKADPKDPVKWAYLGEAEADLAHREAAIADYTQAIHLDPIFKVAHFWRALEFGKVARTYRELDDLNLVIASSEKTINDKGLDEDFRKLAIDVKASLCKSFDEKREAEPSGCLLHPPSPTANSGSTQADATEISIKEQFSRTFDVIFESALEEPRHFQSITGRYDPEHGWFLPLVELPLVSPQTCGIDRQGPEGTWRFYCHVELNNIRPTAPKRKTKASRSSIPGDDSRFSLKSKYSDLVNTILDLRKDFAILQPSQAPAPNTLSTVFVPRSAVDHSKRLVKGGLRSVILAWSGVDGAESLAVVIQGEAPPKPTFTAAAAPASAAIDSEISSVLKSGLYAALPPPQTSTNGTSGVTTVEITNATPYILRILTSGPTSNEYSIPPGRSQDLQVVQGQYRLLGKVAAENVLPFYGTATYEPGSKYAYRFYIQ